MLGWPRPHTILFKLCTGRVLCKIHQQPEVFCIKAFYGIILRVSDQNGVSPLYFVLEIHHSGRELSNISCKTDH